MTERMDVVTFVAEAVGQQVYKQTTKFVHHGATVCENADLTAEINRRVLLANLRFRRHSSPLYDQPETMLYGCISWSPTVAHLAILRTAHHGLPLRCIGWKIKLCDGYHMFSYADALAKTGCKSVETTVLKAEDTFRGVHGSYE